MTKTYPEIDLRVRNILMDDFQMFQVNSLKKLILINVLEIAIGNFPETAKRECFGNYFRSP